MRFLAVRPHSHDQVPSVTYFFYRLFPLAILAISPLLSMASEVLDYSSSRTLGVAEGGRAAPVLGDAIYANPSSMGLVEIQGISGSWVWQRLTPVSPEAAQRALHVGIVDSRNPYVAAGVAYTNRTDLHIIHMAAARKLTSWLSVGSHAKRFWTRDDFGTLEGPYTGYDGGMSATFQLPSEGPSPLRLALTTDNLVSRDRSEKYIGGRKLSAALRLSLKEILFLQADYTQVLGKSKLNGSHYVASGELAFGYGLFARGGYGFGRNSAWGVGGGWMGPKFGVNYGYERRFNPRGGFQHGVTLDLFM